MKAFIQKHSRRENTISPVTNLVLNIIFFVYMLSCVLPVLLIFIVSFTEENSLMNRGYSLFPEKLNTLAYQFLFSDSGTIVRAYGVTILVTVVGTTLNVLITAMFAYPLSRNNFPFKRFMSLIILLPMLFSGGLVPFYMIYVSVLHVKNTLFALILPGMFGGFNVFVMRTYFKSNIPDSLVESAFMDGASEIRIFFSIIMPLARPVLATTAFFCFLGYWNEWFNCSLFITNDKLYNIQYVMMKAIREITFFKDNLQKMGGYGQAELNKVPSEGVRMAMAVVGMLPILVAYPFFQRYFIRGMVIGAVKG